MSRATVTVRLELEGDAEKIVDRVEEIDAVLHDYFDMHLGVRLVGNISITTKNEWGEP